MPRYPYQRCAKHECIYCADPVCKAEERSSDEEMSAGSALALQTAIDTAVSSSLSNSATNI